MELDRIKLKVCMLGDERVGKTCLIRRFAYQEFDDVYMRTFGTTVVKQNVELRNEGFLANLMIWDILGSKEYFSLIKDSYTKNAKGIVAVVDLTRPETLTSLSEWLDGLEFSGDSVSTIVLANKADLRDEIRMSDAEIEEFCSKLSCSWLKTSAKTGENVLKAFQCLTKNMIRSQASRLATV